MKTLIALLCSTVSFAQPVSTKTLEALPFSAVLTAVRSKSQACDPALWSRVYHPTRLFVVEACIEVSGVIRSVRREPDGDFHIRLILDPIYKDLLNTRNLKAQYGSLVLEPVCEVPVVQQDAILPCYGYRSTVPVPRRDVHVRVIGSYVLDMEPNHGWLEIHPVTSIKVQ